MWKRVVDVFYDVAALLFFIAILPLTVMIEYAKRKQAKKDLVECGKR